MTFFLLLLIGKAIILTCSFDTLAAARIVFMQPTQPRHCRTPSSKRIKRTKKRRMRRCGTDSRKLKLWLYLCPVWGEQQCEPLSPDGWPCKHGVVLHWWILHIIVFAWDWVNTPHKESCHQANRYHVLPSSLSCAMIWNNFIPLSSSPPLHCVQRSEKNLISIFFVGQAHSIVWLRNNHLFV